MVCNSITTMLDTTSEKNNKGIIFVLDDKNENSLSYSKLWDNAQKVLGSLQYKGICKDDKVILQIDDNESFITLFWACIFGGIIPVPVTVGSTSDHKQKLVNIWRVLKSAWMVAGENQIERLEEFLDGDDKLFGEILHRTITLKDIDCQRQGIIHKSSSDDIALIQFSSGSTGFPKGIVLTHKNIISDVLGINKALQTEKDDLILSWMPLTHDMGLIAVHIAGVVAGINQVLFPTNLFIRHPSLWMDVVHKHRATQLYSPNFGFKHFLSFYDKSVTKDWDLSCIRIIVNGAEPISDNLCSDFTDKMYEYGMKKNVMVPGYGLAEGTVGVSFQPVGEMVLSHVLDRKFLGIGQPVRYLDDMEKSKGATFVDVGYPVEKCNVRICDEDHQVLQEGTIGCIQISGDTVTEGYYNNPIATGLAITKDGWLNTGDLGFIKENRLVITGRAKDVFFINGQNYYCHDVERVAQEVEDIELGKVAVCSVYRDKTQTNDVIVFVLSKKKLDEFLPIADKLKRHINRQTGIKVNAVIPIKKMPKTTSGKVQRYRLSSLYEEGAFLEVVTEMERLACANNKLSTDRDTLNSIQERLVQIWERVLGTTGIDINDNFFEIGGSSSLLVRMIYEIEKETGVDLNIIDSFKVSSILELSEMIDEIKTLKRSTVIKQVLLPKQYSASSPEVACVTETIEFIIHDKLLNAIRSVSISESVKTDDVILLAYLLLLSKISGHSDLSVQVVGHTGAASILTIDFSSESDFSALVKYVNHQVHGNDGNNTYSLSAVNRMQPENDFCSILPIFCNSLYKNDSKLFNRHNTAFIFTERNNDMFVKYKFNSSGLNKDMVEAMIKDYLKIVMLITDGYRA